MSPRPRTTRARGAAGGLSENAWQMHVLGLAGAYGWRDYHTHDSRRSNPGFPDLVLVRVPELLFVELKTDTGRIRPDQRVWLDLLEAVGEAVLVATALAGDALPSKPAVEALLWRPQDFEAVHARLARGRRQVPVPAPDAGGHW